MVERFSQISLKYQIMENILKRNKIPLRRSFGSPCVDHYKRDARDNRGTFQHTGRK